MFGVHVSGVFLFLTAPIFVAQEPSQLSLKVQVQDVTGAFIPGAMVQLRSEETSRDLEVQADENGNATLTLDQGRYKVIVRAQGFMNWSTIVDIEPKKALLIKANLKVGSFSGPYVVEVADTGPWPDRFVPDEKIAEIPLMLLNLPSRKMHRRYHHAN